MLNKLHNQPKHDKSFVYSNCHSHRRIHKIPSAHLFTTTLSYLSWNLQAFHAGSRPKISLWTIGRNYWSVTFTRVVDVEILCLNSKIVPYWGALCEHCWRWFLQFISYWAVKIRKSILKHLFNSLPAAAFRLSCGGAMLDDTCNYGTLCWERTVVIRKLSLAPQSVTTSFCTRLIRGLGFSLNFELHQVSRR